MVVLSGNYFNTLSFLLAFSKLKYGLFYMMS